MPGLVPAIHVFLAALPLSPAVKVTVTRATSPILPVM
jgi:hypothetical protein